MQRRLWTISLVMLFGMAESSCQKKHVTVPIPSAPAPSQTPAAQEQQPKPTPRPKPANPVPSTPAPAAPEQAPAPPLRLGEMLTPEQQRQYNANIDQSLSRAQTHLRSIARHSLTKQQQTTVAQIQSFMEQAQQTRKSDLSAARSLAERADVLARDLAGSLK